MSDSGHHRKRRRADPVGKLANYRTAYRRRTAHDPGTGRTLLLARTAGEVARRDRELPRGSWVTQSRNLCAWRQTRTMIYRREIPERKARRHTSAYGIRSGRWV